MIFLQADRDKKYVPTIKNGQVIDLDLKKEILKMCTLDAI